MRSLALRRAALVATAAGTVGAAAHFGWDESVRSAFVHVRNTAGSSLYRTLVEELVFNPWFYAVFALTLVLEWKFPAQPGKSSLTSRGSWQDMLWVFIKLPILVTGLPLLAVTLHYVYDNYLSFLTIHAVAEWPWLAKVILALLLGDLIFWLSHLLRHRIRTLWYFHAVHHSQRDLNFFTEYRTHPFDDVFTYLINFIPTFMVEPGLTTVIGIVWIRHWHTRFYHANIRTNMGPLRYILVTPQSHRVHHSTQPEHFDCNFGLTFSIWDHLFGTQYRNYDEYPETGIPDEHFPFEQEQRDR